MNQTNVQEDDLYDTLGKIKTLNIAEDYERLYVGDVHLPEGSNFDYLGLNTDANTFHRRGTIA